MKLGDICSSIKKNTKLIRSEENYNRRFKNAKFDLKTFKDVSWLAFITREKKREIISIKTKNKTKSLQNYLIKKINFEFLRSKNIELFRFLFGKKKLSEFDRFVSIFVLYISCVLQMEKFKLLPKNDGDYSEQSEAIKKRATEYQIILCFKYGQILVKYSKLFKGQNIKETRFFEGLYFLLATICTYQFKNREGTQSELGALNLLVKNLVRNEVLRLFKTRNFVNESIDTSSNEDLVLKKNLKKRKIFLKRKISLNKTENYKSPLIKVIYCRNTNEMGRLSNKLDLKDNYVNFYMNNKSLISRDSTNQRGKLITRIVSSIMQEEKNIDYTLGCCKKLRNFLRKEEEKRNETCTKKKKVLRNYSLVRKEPPKIRKRTHKK